MGRLDRLSIFRLWCRIISRASLIYLLGPRHAARRMLANRRHRAALESKRRDVARTMWRNAAAEIGATVRDLGPSLLEFRVGSCVTRVRGQTTPFADPVSCHLASDKALSYELLKEAGLPVPDHAVVDVRKPTEAERFFDLHHGPCVVKPVHGGGGSGVSGEIRTRAQLRRALVAVGRCDVQALVERQIEGESYRVLVLDGVVLDILRRARPVVVGDGKSTIEQLVFAEQSRRVSASGPHGLKPLLADLDCVFTLQHAGHRLSDVLPAGAMVVVKTATNYNGPTQTTVVGVPYPEGLVEPALCAAGALGVRLAGVDIVTPDPMLDLATGAGAVLEVNPVPGLTHHYNVASGTSQVAVTILRTLLGVSHR